MGVMGETTPGYLSSTSSGVHSSLPTRTPAGVVAGSVGAALVTVTASGLAPTTTGVAVGTTSTVVCPTSSDDDDDNVTVTVPIVSVDKTPATNLSTARSVQEARTVDVQCSHGGRRRVGPSSVHLVLEGPAPGDNDTGDQEHDDPCQDPKTLPDGERPASVRRARHIGSAAGHGRRGSGSVTATCVPRDLRRGRIGVSS